MAHIDRFVAIADAVGNPISAGNPLPTTGGGGGGAVTVADGADVAEGSTTDSAVTGDNPGTLSAKLRGLNKILFNVWDSGAGKLKVDAGTIGTGQQDKSSFVEGTTNFTPVGGVRNDTLAGDVAEDNAAAARITPKRGVHANLRKDDGTELGTSTDPVRTDPTGTTAQPVTDNGGSLTVDDGGGSLTTDSPDGAHVALGATTDAEATGNGSVIAILKRLRTILTDVWDDANNWFRAATTAAVEPVTSGSIIIAGGSVTFIPTGGATTLVQILGSFTGNLHVEVGVTNEGPETVNVYRLTTGQELSVISQAGQYIVPTAGMGYLSVVADTLTVGSVDVDIRGTQSTELVRLLHSLPTGTNTIGAVALGSQTLITDTITALNDAVFFAGTSSSGGVLLVISGTWDATLEVEIAHSVGTLETIPIYDIVNQTIITQIVANGKYYIPISGAAVARVIATVFTSGTATVTVRAHLAGNAFYLINPIPPGTNNIGDVDVLSVIPGTGATNLGKAEDAAHISADTCVAVLGVRTDTPAERTDTDGDYMIPSLTKIGATRIARDDRMNATPKKYMITLFLSGSASAGTNLGGLRKQNANPDVFISKLQVTLYHAAAGVGNPIRFQRATTVAGGSQVTAADIPKLDTAAGDATLEVRTGAVTGTKANQPFWIAGSNQVTTTNQGGPLFEWKAEDMSDRIRLTGDEGVIIDQGPINGDADDRFAVTICWEEE